MDIERDNAYRRAMERTYGDISPFELKNELIRLAEAPEEKSARVMLDAGRGNPNWIATTPREAFFTLGQFALEESRRVWDEGHLGGKPTRSGVASRLRAFVDNHRELPGVRFLWEVVEYGTTTQRFDADDWVFELVDGIIGDNYPTPDRMLVCTEKVVHAFLTQELCANAPGCGKFNLFAVEGATAAMCYIFDTLLENYLLSRGDKVAIMVPIFPPYVEIPHLSKYDFDIIEIKATGVDDEGNHTWQYPDSEIEKLAEPSVKALFLVNPSNPPSVAIRPETIRHLVDIVQHRNPQLMVISDDVYSTFVDGFRSVMAELPNNTIGVYSLSKYFGVTGWRLGVVAVNEENVFDKLLKQLPEDKIEILNKRYASLCHNPQDLRFIDRLVADSREVALNHTAGLSTPQQIQMALCAAFALLDKANIYKQRTKEICRRRMHLLYEGLGLPTPTVDYGAYYYTEFDLALWANRQYGKPFAEYLRNNYEPIDILFRLAEESSIVLLNGGGFRGPQWSIRVSLANLDDDAYSEIGRKLHEVLEGYIDRWKASQT